MTTLSVANKMIKDGIGVTNGPEDLDYLLRRKRITFSPGSLAAKAAFNGCFGYLTKAVQLRSVYVSDMVGQATHATDCFKATFGYNDGAAGGAHVLAAWSNHTGEATILVTPALHVEKLAAANGWTDRHAIPAGSCFTLQLADEGAGAGAVTHLVIQVEYDEVG
jgi:hypothetical protein